MPPSSKDAPQVNRVMVATDRSETASRAVRWAASFAGAYDAELLVLQVVVPKAEGNGADDEAAAAAARTELESYVTELAGDRGIARVVIDDDPAGAIVDVANNDGVDTLVVGNVGMSGRKEFLLGNIPNRISHNAHCTVIIVNTAPGGTTATTVMPIRRSREPDPVEPHMVGRATRIGVVMAKHGLKDLFSKHAGSHDARLAQAGHLRSAFEELGPTFSKLGQILSTRPDLLPPEFIEELAKLQDDVPPLTEAEVVTVMEQELQVPWEDVFDSIEPEPLAAGTIAQVHRATLTGGDRVVLKVQRPTARDDIMQDLALLELFGEKTERRHALRQVVDLPEVFKHLSDSLQRELDFRQEAANMERLRRILESYSRLDVPQIHSDLSTSRLLVMEEIPGVGIDEIPDGPVRKEAARQLLESFYRQILTEGFFHADPHPGNLLWWNDTLYLIDLGMVGRLDDDVRDNLVLLLLAFWQGDIPFLTDVTFMLAGGADRSDIDVDRFSHDLGMLVNKYRNVSLKEIQLGPILQEMTTIAVRYGVPLPASLTLTGKAMAQMQLATGELDPNLDPFDVAGNYVMRSMSGNIREKADPKKIFYEFQKLKIRFTRLIEAGERLVGARPGPKLQVNFRAERFEDAVRRGVRRLSLGITAGAGLVGTAIAAAADGLASWIPISLGTLSVGLVAVLLVDLIRSD